VRLLESITGIIAKKVEKLEINWYAKNGRSRPIDYLEANQEWQENHPKATKAHWLVRSAIKSGKLIKPTKCTGCGRETRLSGHHNDYSKSLEVEWLCSSCHKLRHIFHYT
jgi:hypothetical protein